MFTAQRGHRSALDFAWLSGVEAKVANQILPFADAVTDWRSAAACQDTDPELFFPVGTTGPAVDQIAAAKAVCLSCMSRAECLEFALSTHQDSGVWGGLAEEERRDIRRARAAARKRALAQTSV